MQARWAEEGRPSIARERVFSAEVLTLVLQDARPLLTAFGEINSRRTLELRAPAAGTVLELAEGFENGGEVTAGALLLRIDPPRPHPGAHRRASPGSRSHWARGC